jgi:molybdopterin converting factor small subunit
MATVLVPTMLRELCGGARQLEVAGTTLGEVLRGVDGLAPGFYERVVEAGEVRPELAIAIDGEASGFPLHEPVSASAEIAIVPAIGGGQG